ncbi:uncharacterized protein LOC104883109 isoform X2 [Beta vulgaris subsp. vulgaris]|uniref:uncharacterized protein LOC104883109 isoform X2 n=1 Tax=Beta vulgaris subsp. vulgaris TaxID=3555 RepID=UPI0005402678|nr:uncharacterized protein LOC104883109 isoform X2 [Beta vulgaris subsp. vulgaris]
MDESVIEAPKIENTELSSQPENSGEVHMSSENQAAMEESPIEASIKKEPSFQPENSGEFHPSSENQEVMEESPIEVSIKTEPSFQSENSGEGQLSPEKLIAKGIAPVKKEFLRPPPSSRSTNLDNRDENGKSDSSKSTGIVKEKKSKRQLKRERREERESALNICPAVAKTGDASSCKFGDKCRFSHDFEAYKSQRPADLEGECPFISAQKNCPYGVTCRFYGTHKDMPSESLDVLQGGADVNPLKKDVQKLLWKNKMKYPKSDAALKQLGLVYQEETSPNHEVHGHDEDGQYQEEDDDDYEEFAEPTQSFSQLLSPSLSQPPSTQSQIPPSPQTNFSRKRVWDPVEDENLILAFMNTSLAEVVGTSKKKSAFWGKVWDAFEAGRRINPIKFAPRNADMVKGRWSRVAPPVLRWDAFYDEALVRKRSGQNDSDVIREAHLLYNRKHGRFLLEHAWTMFKKFPEWKAIIKKSLENPRGRPKVAQENLDSPGSRISSKRPRVDGSDSMPDTPTTGEGGEEEKRLDGVKKAKHMRKGVVGETIDFNSFNERVRLPSESRSGDAEIERKRMEVHKKMLALKDREIELATRSLNLQEYRMNLQEYHMNYDILQTLSMKENRLPNEEAMVQRLTTWFQNNKLCDMVSL